MSLKGLPMRIALGLLALCLLVASLVWYAQRITVAEVRNLIDQRLPKGSSAIQVAQVLDSLRITHTEVYPSQTGHSDFTPGPGRYMNASIEDLRRGNLLADGIFIVFRFDDQDRLLDYSANYSFTAL